MDAFLRRTVKSILIAILSIFYKCLKVDTIYKSYLYLDSKDIPSNIPYCLIPGARLFKNDVITPMLIKRLDAAIELYQMRPQLTFILSGDASKDYSNDVQAMYAYLKEHSDIPDIQILFDNEGYTTLDTMCHITPEIEQKGFILLTSAFHMPRCVYICHRLGLHPYALHLPASPSKNDSWYKLRELSALVKNWFLLTFLR